MLIALRGTSRHEYKGNLEVFNILAIVLTLCSSGSVVHIFFFLPRSLKALKVLRLYIAFNIYGRGGSLVVFGALGAEGRWFEFHSSRHVGTLGKSFTRSCLYDVMWRPAWLPCS